MDQQQKEIIGWIETVLGEVFEDKSFVSILKDGVVLCKLLNKTAQLDLNFKETKQIFMQRENIATFLGGLKKLGLNEYELFQTNDLFEERNIKQVIICMYALSRQLQKDKKFEGPFIGPQLAKQNKIEFSQEVLNKAKYAVHHQMDFGSSEDVSQL